MHTTLSNEDRTQLNTSLVELVEAATSVADSVFGLEPPGTSAIAHKAYLAAYFADLAALDHVGMLAGGYIASPRQSVSFATLTRGAIEAFSRVYWLLTAGTERAFIGRHAGMSIADLEYVIKHRPGPVLKNLAGEAFTAQDHVDAIRSEMSRNGVAVEKMPGMTKLVEQFLDDVYGAGGRQQYSYLSGVAHGETFAVNQFLDALFDDEAPSVARAVTLVLPRDMAIQLAGQLGRCCGYVHDELAKLLDSSESDTIGVRWVVARDTAFERLAEMDKSRSDA